MGTDAWKIKIETARVLVIIQRHAEGETKLVTIKASAQVFALGPVHNNGVEPLGPATSEEKTGQTIYLHAVLGVLQWLWVRGRGRQPTTGAE